ncbi:hypothetical protein ACFQ0M_02785 [Kitasatospora aburaviensis]
MRSQSCRSRVRTPPRTSRSRSSRIAAAGRSSARVQRTTSISGDFGSTVCQTAVIPSALAAASRLRAVAAVM